MKKMIGLMALGLLLSGVSYADDERRSAYYEVTVTNITHNQTFTPILLATHKPGVRLFTLGSAASPQLAILAEGGDTGPVSEVLRANPDVLEVMTIDGLLAPGASVTHRIRTQGRFDRLSMAAMLIPTNDGFFALNGIAGPRSGHVMELRSPAYDAGSEPNDELCQHIPGPVCGGEGTSPNAGGEGYVAIHPGIHGVGSLAAARYDWRNPVASIQIRRVY